MMRRSSRYAIATMIAFFLTAFASAQEEQHEQPNAQPQEQKIQKSEKEEMPKPPKEEKKQEKQDHQVQGQEQSKPVHEEHGEKPDKIDRNNDRNNEARGDQHGRPAGKSAHIPDDKFRAHFGREHHFTVTHVVHETVIVPGRTNFVYGGYTFVFVDPWPAEWAYTDDCYVDFIDGEYFLLDVMHPEVRIALFVQG